jgi:hypothetical protein
MLAALACGLSARHPADRAGAVDALLVLAARHQLDGATLGGEIGELAGKGVLTLGRVGSALGDLARSGALSEAWAALMAALPWLLPPRVERLAPGVGDLVALATEVAQPAGARTVTPELADLARSGSAGRAATEARRLQRLLHQEASPAGPHPVRGA